MKLFVRFYITKEAAGTWDNNYVDLVMDNTREDVARLCREGVWVKDTFIPPQVIVKATLRIYHGA